ncbi:hypothetical protein [Xenorhabdus beddingii]|uniref:hypothetical protein n=1 Tax=Xenorhabdus beddingii TaxID=40578 RepID=UPI001428913B|nr:hypothetical protein [Xenorhabdus beddingii]
MASCISVLHTSSCILGDAAECGTDCNAIIESLHSELNELKHVNTTQYKNRALSSFPV